MEMQIRQPTKREIHLVLLLANGFKYKGAAEAMDISTNTVKGYLNNLFFKTGATNTANLIYILTKQGLLAVVLTVSLLGTDTDKHRRHTPRRIRPAAVYIAKA